MLPKKKFAPKEFFFVTSQDRGMLESGLHIDSRLNFNPSEKKWWEHFFSLGADFLREHIFLFSENLNVTNCSNIQVLQRKKCGPTETVTERQRIAPHGILPRVNNRSFTGFRIFL